MVVGSVGEPYPVTTKDGKTVNLDILRESTEPFGFLFQDRVQTPRGLATVLGVCDQKLYFLVDGDAGASYWSTCCTAADFFARKFTKVALDEQYRVKQIFVNGQKRFIVLQERNGACPIIALTNTLALKGIVLDPIDDAQWVATKALRDALGKIISNVQSPPSFFSTENEKCTLAKFIQAAEFESLQRDFIDRYVDVFKKCLRDGGVICTPIFSGVEEFLLEREERDSIVFAMAGLRLLHGWVIPKNDAAFSQFHDLSFNELVLRTAQDDPSPERDAAQLFLANHSSQLTDYGIQCLREAVEEGEYFVLFRNNHFSTAVKLKDRLLCLVSDNAYEYCRDIVFEELSISGSGCYFDGNGTAIPQHILRVISRRGSQFTAEQIEAVYQEIIGEGAVPTGEELVSRLENKVCPVQNRADAVSSPQPHETANTDNTSAVESGTSALMQMGFSRDLAEAAMKRSNSVEVAVDYLMSGATTENALD